MNNIERFVSEHIPGCERGFGKCSTIGFSEKNALVAGIVYHNWVPEQAVIEISAASTSRRWLTRRRLWEIFEYPFNQLECRLCVARISVKNRRACRIWRALGAEEYRIKQMRGPDEDEMIYTLSETQWRGFMKGNTYGQTNSSNPA